MHKFRHVKAVDEDRERGMPYVCIFGGANGGDEEGEVPRSEVRMVIKAGNGSRIPGAGDKCTGPEGWLGGGAAGYKGEDQGDDLSGERDFAG